MKVYLFYLKSSIPFIKDIDSLSCVIKDIVLNDVKISDTIEVVCRKCNKLPGDMDVLVVINSSMAVSIDTIENIERSVFDAVQKDQGLPKCYKVVVKFDSSYSPDMPRKQQSSQSSDADTDSEIDYEKRAQNYQAVEPEYTFDRVILPDKVRQKIDEALNIFKHKDKVFNKWGLRAIEPHPSSSLSFYGPSGTGKTMAAEAIASYLGKKILRVSYADIESKYHGEGPKMVKAIFCAAERDDAVLFIDESDSLLSKRLTNVSSGSEQAINSMRSQLLISLERFEGIVIFATNLVVNYDQAFLTRLISVEFTLPDVESRKKIWKVHTMESEGNKLNIPFTSDVNLDALAEKYEFCGREIKKAVISACMRTAMDGREQVSQNDFISACDRIIEEEKALASAKDHTTKKKSMTPEQEDVLKKAIKAKLDKEKSGANDGELHTVNIDQLDSSNEQ